MCSILFLQLLFINTADPVPDSILDFVNDSAALSDSAFSSESIALSDSVTSFEFDLGTPEDAWCLATKFPNFPGVISQGVP